MTQHNPGRHAAEPRRFFLAQPDDAQRSRDAGRRIAEAPAGATRRPRMAHLVPLGALLVAITSAVAVAPPGDHAEAPTTTSAKESRQPPAAPHALPSGAVSTPAAYITPPAGRDRAEQHSAGTPAAAPQASSAGRHRAYVVQPQPMAKSQPAGRPKAEPAAQETQAAEPATPTTTTPTTTPTPATTPGTRGAERAGSGGSGGLVRNVAGTFGGLVGGLLGNGGTAAR